MFEVTCARCGRTTESNVAQKCAHCDIEPLCEACIPMDVHNCMRIKPMDEDNTEPTSAAAALLNAIDDYYVAKNGGNVAEADNAFDALMEVYNDVKEVGYA